MSFNLNPNFLDRLSEQNPRDAPIAAGVFILLKALETPPIEALLR